LKGRGIGQDPGAQAYPGHGDLRIFKPPWVEFELDLEDIVAGFDPNP